MKKNNDYDMADQSQEPGMNLTRRRFLAGASALMAAPLLAGLWPRSALAEAISQAMPQFIALRQAESGILTAPTGAHLKPSSATAKWWTYARSKTIRIPTN